MASHAPTLDTSRAASPGTAGMPALHMVIFVGLLVLSLVAPFVLYPVFVMKVLCFALFACAFNLLLGFGGLLSFGHAAYFGGASYVSAHAAKVWGLSPELAILAGTAAAAVLGLAIGSLAIRCQGIYFAMVTLAFAQMVFFFSVQAPFTGGEDGTAELVLTTHSAPGRAFNGALKVIRELDAALEIGNVLPMEG